MELSHGIRKPAIVCTELLSAMFVSYNSLIFYNEDICMLNFAYLQIQANMEGADAADRNVEMWKIKKLIKSLEAARG